MAATLVLDIVANATKAVAGMRQIDTAAGNAGQSAEKTGGKFGTMAKAAGAAAGAAALGGVVTLFKTGVDEQKDFLAGQAQLANGIKTTGNAAHVSVSGLENLAGSIQGYSGQTDDSIVASEKLLLTFTDIHNQTGKNNDIFNQATKITADMAAKMGGDASKYAVQLGKALNDPTKGISSLTRVGVSFSDSQKTMIKKMQASGDTMGAQKIILGELKKEFGGSAKAAGDTLPGQLAKAQRSFEDIAQAVVASLMPVLTALADILTKYVLPAFKAVMGFIMNNKEVFGIIAGAILAIVAAVKIWTAVQTVLNFVLEANPILLIVVALIAIVAALVLAYQKSETFRNIVQTAFGVVASVAKVMWSVLKTVFTAIWNILKFVGTLWFTLYVKPFIVAYQILKAAITLAVGWITTAFNTVIGFFKDLPGNIASWLSTLWGIITAPFRAAWQWIWDNVITPLVAFFKNIPGQIQTELSTLWAIIKWPFEHAWNWIWDNVIGPLVRFFKNIPGQIQTELSTLWNIIKWPFEQAWNWIWDNVIGPLVRFFQNLPGQIQQELSTLWNIIKWPFEQAWNWIKHNVIDPLSNAFSNVRDGIENAMSGVRDAITAPFEAAWHWIRDNVIEPIGNGFSSAIQTIKDVWNGFAGVWNGIDITLPSVHIPFGPTIGGQTIGLPELPTFAAGAYVTGPTVAMVGEAGREFVAPEPMLRRLIREELGGGGISITVNGALDPDAVARQIESLLTRRNRRVNGVTRRGAAT